MRNIKKIILIKGKRKSLKLLPLKSGLHGYGHLGGIIIIV
jgi:hypothetical protein